MAAAFSQFLGVRYLLSRKINLLGMIGIGLAVWALIVVVAVFSGFISEIRSNTKNASPDLLWTDLPDDASYRELREVLTADADVVATAPRLRQEALYYPHGGAPTPVPRNDPMPMTPLAFEYVELIGVDFDREREVNDIESWFADDEDRGSRLRVEDQSDPLRIDPKTYQRTRTFMGNRSPGTLLRTPPGLLLGAPRAIRLLPAHEVSIVAARAVPGEDGRPLLRKVRRIFALSGSFQSKNRVFDATKALVDIEEVRSALGQDEFDPDAIDLVSDIGIRIAEGADLQAVAARLRDATGDEGRILTWEEQNALYLSVVDQERGLMKLVLFAVILVSVFLIYATMHMMVTQKTKDIGILSSMGATRAGIRNIFLFCALIIATVGCLGGAAIGWLTAIFLDAIDRWVSSTTGTLADWLGIEGGGIELFPRQLYALDEIPTQVEPSWVLQVSLGAFLMTLLAAWFPARRAASFEPVRALGYE